ncbi:MAG: hypothetical protein LBN37_05800 [Bacteroidales bacterium]|jgi:hypothetical protein|nr:hypothetical protein [Bacteroidales bacterium]
MLHQQYTEYLKKELGFLKLLISRIHEQENIADVELDLALTKTQGIYEQLLKLKLIHRQLAEVDKEKTLVQKPVAVPEPEQMTVEPEKTAPEPPVVKPVPAPEKKPAKPEKTAESATQKGESGILADKIRPTGYNPINEALAQKNPVTDLAGKLQGARLNTISSGIGLNERFLYIRELFGGNGDLYNDTIKKLDTAGSLAEALGHIADFKWNTEDENVQKFIALVHRKHAN